MASTTSLTVTRWRSATRATAGSGIDSVAITRALPIVTLRAVRGANRNESLFTGNAAASPRPASVVSTRASSGTTLSARAACVAVVLTAAPRSCASPG